MKLVTEHYLRGPEALCLAHVPTSVCAEEICFMAVCNNYIIFWSCANFLLSTILFTLAYLPLLGTREGV